MRHVPVELAKRYEQEGWWTQETIGQLLASALKAAADTSFRVHSAVRPWSGTYGDVEQVARRLAAGLRDRGVGPGDVVAFQLPNWMEAAATFWASAFLGAVTVPIVHFYGHKELGQILAEAAPRVFITAERFGQMSYQKIFAHTCRLSGWSAATSTICWPLSPWPAQSPPTRETQL